MEKLGIELPLLITQIVNFAIMVFILTKLLYKPILKSLQDRRKKIEEGLALTAKMQLEEEKLAKKREEVLRAARAQAQAILENARKEGIVLKDELITLGKKEAAHAAAKMEAELAAKYAKLEKELTGKTVDIASEMVKRLLPEIIDSSAQHKFIQKELTKLERSHGRG